MHGVISISLLSLPVRPTYMHIGRKSYGFQKNLRFKNQSCNRLYPKNRLECIGKAVMMLNEATSRIFQPTANFENFEIHLYFVCQPACQPAVRPGCARCRAPEISHNKGNGGGFTKMLFQRRFTHCTMAIPFIHHSLPCSSIFL